MFLSVISLVSVGFSTWTIGSNTANATFNMGADDVDGTNKYFFFNETLGTIDDPSITNPTVPFEYNDYGVINNGVVTSLAKANLLSLWQFYYVVKKEYIKIMKH